MHFVSEDVGAVLVVVVWLFYWLVLVLFVLVQVILHKVVGVF